MPTVKDTAVANGSKVIPVKNALASTIDSTKRRYEVIGAGAATLAEANKVIENFKGLGIDGHIVSGLRSKKIKISLGTYATRAEADSAIKELKKTKKVKDAWPLTINPKK
jgi:cell division protein FtsN